MTDDRIANFQGLREIWDKKLAEYLAKPGWSLMEDQNKVWDVFYEKYDFRPSTSSVDWPGIKEPTPSHTYDIRHVFQENYDGRTRDLGEFYLACFANTIPKGQLINVLDWQHECFRFDPHAGFTFKTMEDWPIQPLPDGDYYIFLTPDLDGGFFGHPWEGTICVIGEAFIKQMETAPPDVFSKLIRKDGIAVDGP